MGEISAQLSSLQKSIKKTPDDLQQQIINNYTYYSIKKTNRHEQMDNYPLYTHRVKIA